MNELMGQYAKQHQIYVEQRNLAKVNFEQLSGAIFAIEQLMKELQQSLLTPAPQSVEEPAAVEEQSQGATEDGHTDDQGAEQTA